MVINRSLGPDILLSFIEGKLYLASNRGPLYNTTIPQNWNKRDTDDFCSRNRWTEWSFLNYDGKLFCASDNGVFVMDGDKMEHLDGIKVSWSLVPLNGPWMC